MFKNILQFPLVLVFYCLGNILSDLLMPIILIPGSIIGMLLLFTCLYFNIVKLNYVEGISNFFLKYMGFFFVPLGVSLIESYAILSSIWAHILVILVTTSILVMGVSSKVAEMLINKKEGIQ